MAGHADIAVPRRRRGPVLAGARVLVTGAAGGVGSALAERFAAAGSSLVLTGRGSAELDRLTARLSATSVVADLAEPGGARSLAERCGDTDILVANAALPASGDLLEYDDAQIDRALDVNLRSVVLLVRHVLPAQLQRGRGHIVLVGSMSGKAATPASALYTTTKFGLRGFAHALRQDVAPHGVGVSLVLPGLVSGAGMPARQAPARRLARPDAVTEQHPARRVEQHDADADARTRAGHLTEPVSSPMSASTPDAA